MTLFSWLKRRTPATEVVAPADHGTRPGPLDVRGKGAIGSGRDVVGNAIGPHSTVTYIQQLVQQFGTVGANDLPLEPADVEAAVGEYATQVRQRYGRLDLEVLIPTGEGDSHPPVQLREVFVPPLLRADPPQPDLPPELHKRLIASGELPPEEELPPGIKKDSLERLRRAYLDHPPAPLLDVVTDPPSKRLVLLGDPGAGKSTLGRYLALGLTSDSPPEPLSALAGWLPLVVEVRKYAEAQWRDRTFEDFLDHLHRMERMSVPRSVLEACLHGGRVLVVFDGLDELFDPSVREEVCRRIVGFAGHYENVRIVVTSRVIGYKAAILDGAGFSHYMIQDLTEQQIGEFAKRWYDTVCQDDPERSGRLCERITTAVAYSRPVRELAGNPLLLTILAVIGRRQELPRDRQGVYKHAVSVLIARWDQETKHLKPTQDVEALRYLDDKDRYDLLRLLARRMQDGDGGIAGNHIHGPELEATFQRYLQEILGLPVAEALAAAREMKRQFQERNFILSRFGGEVYGFVHRAFLEYLAATDIAHRYAAREWNEEELIEQVFVRRASDPNWHEVLLLLVGLIEEIRAEDAARAIDALVELHVRTDGLAVDTLVLAVRALAETRKIGRFGPQSKAVVDCLIGSLEGPHRSGDLAAALPALSTFSPHWIGRSRYLRWFHVRGQFEVQGGTPAALACTLYHGPEIPALLARHAWQAETRSASIRLLADRWTGHAGAHPLILDRAVEDPDADVRATALSVLAERWGAEPDTRSFICSRAINDPIDDVRSTALRTLMGGWPGAETESLLRELLTSDSEDPVRYTALRLLTEHGTAGADLDSLVHAALQSDDRQLRTLAVTFLADQRADRPDTYAIMSERVSEDPEDDVRGIAVGYLALHARDRTDTYERVRDRAVNDVDWVTRDDALEYLFEHWSDRSETRALLYERAVKDEHYYPRRTALTFVIRRWLQEPATRELVVSRALNDSDESVRDAALEMLATHWHADPRTLDVVRDRAAKDDERFVRQTALDLLIEHWSDAPDTLPLVRARFDADRAERVRDSIMGKLAQHYREAPDTHRLIHDQAVEASAATTRQTALNLLAEHWRDEPGTHRVILDRATNDHDAMPRRAALALLARHWRSEPGTHRLILNRATDDPHEDVRSLAMDLLNEHWSTDPGFAELVRERACHDPSPDLRFSALQWCAWEEPTEATISLVRDRLTNDASPEVRIAAARILTFAWPGHSGTIALLAERARSDDDEEVRQEAGRALSAAEALAPVQDRLP
ncbi:HEAT repeat domain-containing protein [Streptomyces sp. NPDC057301]|uniref:HEAT repeat domain-containing protein n=1 Tax=Streptomyces sp. NPDC057301 TaxID=3346093 RepID=UPI003628F27A